MGVGVVQPTAEEQGRDPAVKRRKYALTINGGRRTIKRLTAELDDGTVVTWEGSGSISLIGTSPSRQVPASRPDTFYAEAILRFDPNKVDPSGGALEGGPR